MHRLSSDLCVLVSTFLTVQDVIQVRHVLGNNKSIPWKYWISQRLLCYSDKWPYYPFVTTILDIDLALRESHFLYLVFCLDEWARRTDYYYKRVPMITRDCDEIFVVAFIAELIQRHASMYHFATWMRELAHQAMAQNLWLVFDAILTKCCGGRKFCLLSSVMTRAAEALNIYAMERTWKHMLRCNRLVANNSRWLTESVLFQESAPAEQIKDALLWLQRHNLCAKWVSNYVQAREWGIWHRVATQSHHPMRTRSRDKRKRLDA
jgi:hypothetical protein